MGKGNINMEDSTPISDKNVTLNKPKGIKNVEKGKKPRVVSSKNNKKILSGISKTKYKNKNLILVRPLSETSIVGNIKRDTKRHRLSPSRKYSLHFKGQIGKGNALKVPEGFRSKRFSSQFGDKKLNQIDLKGKSKSMKQIFAKNTLKGMGSLALSQDEQLEEVNKLNGRWQSAKAGAEFSRKSGKLGTKTARYGVKKGNQVSKRSYSFMKNNVKKKRNLARVGRQVSSKVSYAVSHPVQTVKGTFSAIKAAGTKVLASFGKLAAANPYTWIVAAFAGLLLIVVSVIAFIAAIVVIKQDEFDLTDSYAYFTKIDAKHNEDGNEFYTDPDDVMVYMNYKFDSYKLDDKVTYQKMSDKSEKKEGTFKDYLADLWTAMNGEKDNYSPTDISTLYDVKPYKLSSKEQDELKEMTKEGKFIALQELSNPYGKEGETLQISRRYGYEKKDGDLLMKNHKNIILKVSSGTSIKAPMDGEVEVRDNSIIITREKNAQIILDNLTGIRIKTGDKVKNGQTIAQMKGDDLTVTYKKYRPLELDLHIPGFYEVNPSFYFENIEYLQQTTLASFSPDADLAARATAFYNQAKKVEPNATIQGISAFLGNFEVESQITPKRAEGDYLKPPVGASKNSWDDPAWLAMGGKEIYNGAFPNILHRGLGLGQWTDTSDGGTRHTLLLQFAQKQNKKWYDMNLQVNFAIAGDSPMYQTIFRSILKTSSSVEDATRQVLTTWEGNPGDKLSQRTEAAKRWYSYFKNSGESGKPSEQLPPEYKGKVKFPAINAQAHSGYPGNNYAWGNCTWYVYNREYQIGHVIASNLGNGGSWGANAKAQGYKTSGTPNAGNMVSFPPGVAGSSPIYGHVAFVEYVNPDGSFLISEMNVLGLDKIDYRVIGSPAGCIFINPVK